MDANGNKATLDDKGILVTDKNSNTVTMSDKGIDAKDKNSNQYTADSNGILVKDKNGNSLELASEGAILSAKKITLKSGDGAPWVPNIIKVCPFTGAPHGGEGGGIVNIKGA